MADLPDIDDARFGTDLHIPTSSRGVGGSLATRTGRDNLTKSLLSRWVETRKSLVDRPDWGSSTMDYLEEANSPANQASLALELRRTAQLDDRIETCVVFISSGTRTGQVIVEATIRVVGESDTLNIKTELTLGA